MSNYIINNGELYHFGVKGMKWGKRRYQNADGTLTPAGVKRYAKESYAQEAYNSNKTANGRLYDKITGSHKIYGAAKYAKSSNQDNKARAEQYLKDKQIEKYAKKGYAQDAYKSNKSVVGRAYDKVTGAHKIAGNTRYNISSYKENEARANKYLAEKNKQSLPKVKKNTANKQVKNTSKNTDKANKEVKKKVKKKVNTGKKNATKTIMKAGSLGVQSVMRYRQNKYLMKAIDSAFSGNAADMYDNAYMYSVYNRVGNHLFND